MQKSGEERGKPGIIHHVSITSGGRKLGGRGGGGGGGGVVN